MPLRKKDINELTGLHPAAGPSESLAKKLGVKPEGMAIALLWAPDGFAARIGIEEGNYDTDLHSGTYDLILLFTGSRVLLREFFPIAIDRMEPDGKVWIAWPKKSEEHKTDLSLDAIQTLAESLDLIETHRCGIEGVWSGIKFKKGVVKTTHHTNDVSLIAPYSISVVSPIPITPDPGEQMQSL